MFISTRPSGLVLTLSLLIVHQGASVSALKATSSASTNSAATASSISSSLAEGVTIGATATAPAVPNSAATVIISQPSSTSSHSTKGVTVGATLAAIFGFIILIAIGIYLGSRKRKNEETWRKSMILPQATTRGEKGMSVQLGAGGSGTRPSSMVSPKIRPGSSLGAGGSGTSLNSPASSIGPASRYTNPNPNHPTLPPSNGGNNSPRMPNSPLSTAATSPANVHQALLPSTPQIQSPIPIRQPFVYQAQGASSSASLTSNPPSIVIQEPQPPPSLPPNQERQESDLPPGQLAYDVPSSMTYPPSPPDHSEKEHQTAALGTVI
ncbi:hypothetical protein FRB94_007758 [Tulasnella sp. JGI-2019a]|nr:hypothetical protein FRB93_011145 [Tulasnella sp. JGI-2019a]KAG9011767.1 hypothetical protein FRB94_007758 [Tulasnella sp. JGI-2019a]KAG9036985.1 hypothetical protein FRB95_007279 [Tulasnella sp. JGI-2019a]